MKDKQLKEKIESVDALSTGVVYGSEEAWDKLQARLDAKPARRIAFIPRLAAAAALLLCILLPALYYFLHPAKSVTKIADQSQPADSSMYLTSLPQIADTSPVTLVVPEQTRLTSKWQSREPKAETTLVITKPVIPVDTHIVVVTQPQPPAPVTPPPVRKMRVVHINDIGNEPDYAAEEMMAYNGPTLNLSKMKVISINDLQREENIRRREQEMMTIVRINRPHGILNLATSLTRPRKYDDPFAYNALTIHFNRKN